jgi:hypothetical protein
MVFIDNALEIVARDGAESYYQRHPTQEAGYRRSPTLTESFTAGTQYSAVLNMYGEAYWNPYDLLNGILDNG